ncbi:hypothetical protein BpHYR1_028485 [Brachionus plicatilis]|uniref:Uncharacterized protein n=1 Tax=Brachionus plicatilis TaxID=10195 RepID=A0A3M7R2Z9_BRAPC|nr:hypothetical protein BpHYR1_028485 [Brachionus plicatilis]
MSKSVEKNSRVPSLKKIIAIIESNFIDRFIKNEFNGLIQDSEKYHIPVSCMIRLNFYLKKFHFNSFNISLFTLQQLRNYNTILKTNTIFDGQVQGLKIWYGEKKYVISNLKLESDRSPDAEFIAADIFIFKILEDAPANLMCQKSRNDLVSET